MGLTELQEAVARLLLDDSVRSNPSEIPNQMPGLSEEDLQIIKSIPLPDLEAAALVLPRKRMKRLEYLFPDTSHLLKDKFNDVFAVFAAEILPRDEMQEAYDFATTLTGMSKLGHISPYAGDIARFEYLLLELRAESKASDTPVGGDPWRPRLSRFCRLIRCNIDLPKVIRYLNTEAPIPDDVRGPKVYLISHRDSKVDLFDILDEQARILERCDGSKSVEELTTEVGKSTGLSKTRASDWFNDLHEKKVLV